MDGIHPINPIQDETADVMAAKQATSVQSKVDGNKIDPTRLQKDPDYYSRTMNYILYKARNAYNLFRYAEAQHYYEQFFGYLKFYRAQPRAVSTVFFPAVFEMRWVLEIQDKLSQAKAFFNQQLLKALEPQAPDKPLPQKVATQIDQLQQRALLPSPANLEVEVQPETLIQLAQQLSQLRAPQAANQLLGFAEAAQFANLYRLQRTRGELHQEAPGVIPLQPLLPFSYRHIGVPAAPYVPMLAEDLGRIRPKTSLRKTEVEEVGAITEVHENPQQEQNQNRGRNRQRRRNTRQSNNTRFRKKPDITI